ncbi:MAG: glycosyltransferase [Terriglobia bacterium]
MDITLIICTFNRAASLETTLGSIQNLALPASLRWEILVVDNNSTDSTREVVEQFAAASGLNVLYLFEKRQGKSYALNTGIREARGGIIAFADDDVTFDRNWLVSLKQALDGWGCIGVGGKIIPVWSHAAPPWLQMDGQQAVGHFDIGEKPREINFAHGANGAFKRESFEKYGLFQVETGPDGKARGGYEDDEFGARLNRHGEKIMYAPAAVVYHPVEPEKLNKAYFRKWFYDTGRAMMWARIWPPETVLYFGIPRFLFGALVQNSVKWPFTLDEKRRFRRECQAWRAAGGILEGGRMLLGKRWKSA